MTEELNTGAEAPAGDTPNPSDSQDVNTDVQVEQEAETQAAPDVETLKREADKKQQRIDYLTKQKYQQEKAIKELLDWKAAQEQKSDLGPKPEDFETEEAYQDAKISHLAEQKLQARLKEQEALTKKSQIEKTRQELQAKAEVQAREVERVKPDYRQKEQVLVQFANTVDTATPQFQALEEGIFKSDNVAELIYHYGDNPDELFQLMEKHPYEILREIVRVDLSLKKSEAAPKPKPPAPVGSGGKVQKELHQLDGKEILKRLGVKS